MYRVYAARPAGADQPRASAAAWRRCCGNDRRQIELMNGAAVLAARHAGHLLRRRDRHGRQRLPRRPQRRAHADAVERRPQRRLLAAPTRSGSTCRSIIDPEYHYETVNVEAQQDNPQLAAVVDEAADRAAQALPGASAAGSIEFLLPGEPPGARLPPRATRTSGSSSSPTCRASSQYAELDLSRVPRARCRSSCSAAPSSRAIGELPYFLTLGPHAFYWFRSSRRPPSSRPGPRDGRRRSRSRAAWQNVFAKRNRAALEDALPGFLRADAVVRRQGRGGSSPSRSPTRSPWRRTEPSSPASSRSSRSSTPRASPRPTSCRSRARPASTPKELLESDRALGRRPAANARRRAGPLRRARRARAAGRAARGHPPRAVGSARTACGSRRIRPRPSAASRARRPTSRTRGRCRPSRATPRSCSATGWS